MSEITKGGGNFVGYEYKVVLSKDDMASMYIDSYESFGWIFDENTPVKKSGGQVLLNLKRDRKIINKVELTRLERHFEACMDEINALERSKKLIARIFSISIGVVGTVFMALSTFAVTNNPPLVLPCILFAIPGFIGWGLPYFIYKRTIKYRTIKVAPLIEKKYDEIYDVCEKGNHLLAK